MFERDLPLNHEKLNLWHGTFLASQGSVTQRIGSCNLGSQPVNCHLMDVAIMKGYSESDSSCSNGTDVIRTLGCLGGRENHSTKLELQEDKVIYSIYTTSIDCLGAREDFDFPCGGQCVSVTPSSNPLTGNSTITMSNPKPCPAVAITSGSPAMKLCVLLTFLGCVFLAPALL